MAGVVIIHAQQDSAPAHALATKLRALGHETATDLTPRLMRGAMGGAEVAVALWSPRSAGNADLVAEARHARGAGKLIHARMHNTPAPELFRGDPSIDLTGWRGDDAFAGWLNLKAAIEGVLLAAQENEDAARAAEEAAAFDAFGDYEPEPPPPPPAPHYAPPRRPAPEPAPAYVEPEIAPDDPAHSEAASDWAALERAADASDVGRARRTEYEPTSDEGPRFSAYGEGRSGYEPRPPRRYDNDYEARQSGEEKSRGGSSMRLAIVGVVTFLVVAGIGIGGYSMIQSGRTSAAAEAGWSGLDKSDPLALRAFLDGEPGKYRQPAEAALEGLEIDYLGRARETDTVQAYQSFLASFPETRHSAEISGRMAMLRQRERDLGLAPPLLEEEKTPEETAAVLETAPVADEPIPAAPVAPEPALPGGPVLLTPQTEDPPPPAESDAPAAAEAQQRTAQELRLQIMQGN
ncbi:MAG: TIR domain-containing protein [Alphaproteobacteria bacterium]|nr:TIR domain-containing protein [Alphaproteobacteria bacterium]